MTEPPENLSSLTEAELDERIAHQRLMRRAYVNRIWDIDSEIVSLKEEIRRRHPEKMYL